MWRVVLSFFCGLCVSALLLGAASVYVFHDVDKDLLGKWNIAFSYLAGEALFFALLVTIGTAILTQFGRMVVGLRPAVPTPKLGFSAGIVIGIVQYPFEFLVRKVADEHYAFWSYAYIVLSIIVPSAIFIAACRRRHDPTS
jgi:hypothetical protein